jgi:hypothetical protein
LTSINKAINAPASGGVDNFCASPIPAILSLDMLITTFLYEALPDLISGGRDKLLLSLGVSELIRK